MLKVASIFSGIGAFEFALKRMGIEHEIVFACDNGERDVDIDYKKEFEAIKKLGSPEEKRDYVLKLYKEKTNKKNFMEMSFLANYKIKKDMFFQDVALLDGSDFRDEVDLFVGGSPCQSFSSVGFQDGLNDPRGVLFFEYARLVKEIRPKVFIYENVRNLINHDRGHTWEVIQEGFRELGYSYSFAILNAVDYGIPQTRRRLFVVGFRDGLSINMPPPKKELLYIMKDFSINFCKEGFFRYDKNGNLKLDRVIGSPDPKYTLTPKLYEYVMKGGTKTFYQKPEINKPIARTLLKTMGNRHRAGVDNYLSFDGTDNLGSVRMLTEREALRLMGFTDDFKIVVSRAQAYKQAGNSIVVDVMMSIINQILLTNVFNEET